MRLETPLQVDTICPKYVTLKKEVAASVTKRGEIVMEKSGLREVITLECSGAIGSLLLYGYQKWISK
jgi:hypothetical protein